MPAWMRSVTGAADRAGSTPVSIPVLFAEQVAERRRRWRWFARAAR